MDDLLLTLVEEAADGHKQNVPGPEQEGHGYRRKSASFQRRQLNSRGCDGEIRRTLSRVKTGTLSSSDCFAPTICRCFSCFYPGSDSGCVYGLHWNSLVSLLRRYFRIRCDQFAQQQHSATTSKPGQFRLAMASGGHTTTEKIVSPGPFSTRTSIVLLPSLKNTLRTPSPGLHWLRPFSCQTT